MAKLIDKIRKAKLMLKIFFQEIFQKCTVAKMSAYFDNNGNLKIANWGDDINYWFLQEISESRIISYDLSMRTRLFNTPYVMGIGSILTMFDINNSIIWGSGILLPNKPFRGKPKEVRAVRGPLTRQKLLESGIDCPAVYGDPALLLPLYYRPNVEKKYKLGVIPQYDSNKNPLLDSLRNDPEVTIIKIGEYEHWLDIVDQICMCETIMSSSLHGLVLAEAYKIPNVWTHLAGDNPLDFFKYHDFFLSLGNDREPLCFNDYVTKESVYEHLKEWSPSNIDLSPLINACPFSLKRIN